MGRKKRSTRNWVAGKRRDVYTRQARSAGYRSRAAYKLQQIDERDHLFRRVNRVLDLGAAPGGWSQYARERLSGGTIVALDLLSMKPIDGVTVLQGDFTDAAARERVADLVSPHAYDLVMSDMAPNITGIADVDQANAASLAEQAIEFAARVLAENGALVLKVFAGSEADRVRRLAQSVFRQCAVRKPGASRDQSREFYLVLRRLRD
ncbi:MAG TPA: RlmE family RNA methyltransferase [Arenicellales bacterium]|nr:RlmE family RNA methyltransferase [Arenicellales bacterium]